MAEYKIKLRINELQIINYISIRKDKREKLQSIYQYIIKHVSLNGGYFVKTNKELHKMYSRYHAKMKSDTFRKILDSLTKFGLIMKKKYKNVNVFTVNRNAKLDLENLFFEDKVPTFVPTFVPTQNIAESVGMTNFDGNNDDTQILNNKINYINITNNTSNDVTKDDYKNSPAYKKACKENNRDTLAPVQLMVIALELLKSMRRRSEKLKSMIRNKLMNKMHIVKKNADKYVETVVLDCIAKYDFNREMYALTITKNKNNYRRAYNKANSTFANFTQRKYDYDKLEKNLLGWGDFEDYII